MAGGKKRRVILGKVAPGSGPGLSGSLWGGCCLGQCTHGDPGKAALTGERGLWKGMSEDAGDYHQHFP